MHLGCVLSLSKSEHNIITVAITAIVSCKTVRHIKVVGLIVSLLGVKICGLPYVLVRAYSICCLYSEHKTKL